MIASHIPIDFNSIDLNRAGYVYLIFAEGTSRYKIGRSKTPINRTADIQKQSPYNLRLVTYFYTLDCIADEKHLHDKLKDYRVFGEWFELTGNTSIEDIEQIEMNSNFADKLWKKSLEIFDMIGVDTDNELFRRSFLGFFLSSIRFECNLENFYYFNSLFEQIGYDRDSFYNSNEMTFYFAGLFNGAYIPICSDINKLKARSHSISVDANTFNLEVSTQVPLRRG